ncbi:MAG: prepilin-type N-terminal cleavage/methylation domain-containing protein [Fimbriimonadaceae bacterium]|nr:prepilin-type N-terminal cleavage/methylation domain-containing protein [Fimbriimonadaceae bacterium]
MAKGVIRRRAFTLVEIMIVVVLIGILMAIAVPHWRAVRERSQERACSGSRERIEKSKQQWIIDNGLVGNSSPTFPDLSPTYLKSIPSCPANGTYTIGDGNTLVSCSIHGS